MTASASAPHHAHLPGHSPASHRQVRLTQLRRGQCGTICDATLDADSAAMLRAMGLRPECRIRLCRVGEPCIVATGADGACRIGLTKRLAERVFVNVE